MSDLEDVDDADLLEFEDEMEDAEEEIGGSSSNAANKRSRRLAKLDGDHTHDDDDDDDDDDDKLASFKGKGKAPSVLKRALAKPTTKRQRKQLLLCFFLVPKEENSLLVSTGAHVEVEYEHETTLQTA